MQLAACAAEFAEILRRSYWARGHKLTDPAALARCCRNVGRGDDVKELIRLIDKAAGLRADEPPAGGEED